MTATGIGISPVFSPFSGAYIDKVLGIEPADLVALWRLAETSGTLAENAQGVSARDGTHSGVTLDDTAGPDGSAAPFYDGVNDYTDIYSTSLNSAFDGAECTVIGWFKIPASVWSDGVRRRLITVRADAGNRIYLEKAVASNRIDFYRAGGGVASSLNQSGLSDTGWVTAGLTASETADEVRFYYNGAQVGSTLTGLGAWTGNLSSSQTAIGANNTTPTGPWNRNLHSWGIWAKALSPAQIQAFSTV